MASTNVNSSWEKIQRGVKDTERLIGQKEYNAAMVRSRQTLEFMVKSLSSRIGLNENQDLMQLIDALYQQRAISKSTCEHYHKIRMIGNKAVHEGDTSAYNANQAYHVLSQEVYSFANDYRNAQRGGRRSTTSRSQSASKSRKKRTSKGPSFQPYNLLKFLIPLLCIVLLVCIIKLVKPAKDKEVSEQTVTTSSEVQPEAPSAQVPETMSAPQVTYKTTSNLRVRSQPNTNCEVLGQLAAQTTVDYVNAYDENWAIITYNGQQAYVSSEFLTTE